MRDFISTRVMDLHAGTVRLDADQYRRRRHLVSPVKGKKDQYTIDKSIQFKTGETFGYDGDIPPVLAECLANPKTGESIKEEQLQEKGRGKVKAKPKSKPEPEPAEDQTGEGEGSAASEDTGAALTGHPLID